MNDAETPVASLKEEMQRFVEVRNWTHHHHPKDLSMSIAIEAAELMELFQWNDPAKPPIPASQAKQDPELMQRVREELSDVICYSLSLANALDIDLTEAFRMKMKMNEDKYPRPTG